MAAMSCDQHSLGLLGLTLIERLPFIGFGILILLILIGLPIYLLSGGLRTFALKPLQRCFNDIDVHEVAKAGDVSLTYHTYRGLLLWCVQSEHRVNCSASDAEKLLGRLLKFNLTWGMLSYGLAFVPFLAIGNYYAQRDSIRKQAAANERDPD